MSVSARGDNGLVVVVVEGSGAVQVATAGEVARKDYDYARRARMQ